MHLNLQKILNTFSINSVSNYREWKNHTSRVYELCILMDQNRQNWDYYAIASVFHDLDLFQNGNWDYLKNSVKWQESIREPTSTRIYLM